ncbi:MAG: AMP-binding protein, partial [Caldilineaceae bacterium]|nr:AMP-binding protein [Caldilineaceae bacterium]
GEACHADLVDRWSDGRLFYNLYGPTETTIWATAAKCEEGDQIAPIGHPIDNTQTYILDADLHPVPTGMVGELYIGGVGVTRGYLNRPGLTAERFIPNPFVQDLGSEQPQGINAESPTANHGSRMYKTGDLARYLPDGRIEFIGRADHQVKIRGFRIELGEIEHVLNQHPVVQQGVVVVHNDTLPDKRLVAYVVPQTNRNGSENEHHLIAKIRADLQVQLPDYMVPPTFIWMDSLPLTPSGKIDRQALPLPDLSDRQTGEEYVAPTTDLEKLVTEIWATVLGVQQIGIYDNFFDLGGHSLGANQILSRLRQSLNVAISLHFFFENPTVAQLVGYLEDTHQAETATQFPILTQVQRDDALPLSLPQEAVWLICQLNPENTAYHAQASFRFRGKLRVDILEKSLTEIIRRHEIFRTTFETVHGKANQVIHRPFVVSLPIIHLQGASAAEQEHEIERLLAKEFETPFELTKLPLVRWTLLKLSSDDYILSHVEHHLVHDGWSFTVFLRELLALYQAFAADQPSPLADLDVQFVDFAHQQRTWIETEAGQQQLSYWQNQLKDCSPLLELPWDYPRPPVQSMRGNTLRMKFPRHLWNKLDALARAEDVTMFMLMFAAFQTLLHRYSGQDDICVGSGMANRRWPNTEHLMGMVINTIVLRTQFGENPTFRELLALIRQTTLEAYANQEMPFEKVVETLQPERNLSHNPIFQVLFGFHDSPMPALDLDGVTLDVTEALSSQSAKFDLVTVVVTHTGKNRKANITPEDDYITIIWEYSTDLFREETIGRMMRHYQFLLEGILADPDQRLLDLPLMTGPEKEQLLEVWNHTYRDYAHDKCIHHLFEAQAAQTPSATALVFQGQEVTYQQLNARANQLAHYLQSLGVGPEVLVGVCVERSVEMVIGMLAILKAGGAYLPLDPSYPSERVQFMLANAQPKLLLTQTDLNLNLPTDFTAILDLNKTLATVATIDSHNPQVNVTPTNLAYVLYTSGSTGQPKGVAIQHHGPMALVNWAQTVFTPSETSQVLATTSICFDLSVFELFVPLSSGGTVVLVEDALSLLSLPKEQEVTLINTVPSAMLELINANGVPSSVQVVNLAGEALQNKLVQQIYGQKTIQKVYNLYGPSEDTTYSTYVLTQAGAATEPSIGGPIDNTQAYILDHNYQPVPIGIPGQLYLG